MAASERRHLGFPWHPSAWLADDMASVTPIMLESCRINTVDHARTLFSPIASEPVELACFAYLDPEWRLLGMRHARSASRHALDVPVRAVAADAIAFDAALVVMAHNHPSGDARPSHTDIAVTRTLARAFATLGTRLIDHLVITRAGSTSFRALGLL